jgi:hypothetical protein
MANDIYSEFLFPKKYKFSFCLAKPIPFFNLIVVYLYIGHVWMVYVSVSGSGSF